MSEQINEDSANQFIGRFQEQDNHFNYVTKRFDEIAPRATSIVDSLGESDQKVLTENAESIAELSRVGEESRWLSTMIDIGMPRDLILHIWDAKIKRDNELIDRVANEITPPEDK